MGSLDRKSGSAGMPRPISYAVFCLKKKKHVFVPRNIQHVNILACFLIYPPLRLLAERPFACESLQPGGQCIVFVPGVFLQHFAHGIFFFDDTANTEIYTLSLHDALPI